MNARQRWKQQRQLAEALRAARPDLPEDAITTGEWRSFPAAVRVDQVGVVWTPEGEAAVVDLRGESPVVVLTDNPLALLLATLGGS